MSRVSGSLVSVSEDMKSVKFGVSSSMTVASLTRLKGDSNGLVNLTIVQPEEPNAITTIRTLLQ